ncbi:FkbM family methyltransferase [Paracoccus lutimaris]|uniref:FkbM family methyltransferase n=1 Tax=Paracoccus lutimaris TaxID=1490030 RepID=A0A368Z759_9RHOB|nr:FkbM family methyltransferase [Paracoccus lutimaris]RCW88292.1 FkbM family methyltransferase [Paracoccus lutimaris]
MAEFQVSEMDSVDSLDQNESEPSADAALFDRAKRVLDRLDQQINLMSNPVDGTCPVFHLDEVFQIALPWASFESYQYRIVNRHSVPDPVLFTQLFDLIPTLAGKALLDIGSFTGLQALVIRRFMSPSHVHMIEPQNMLQAPLKRTIDANPEGCPVTLVQEIIDDETSAMAISAVRTERLSETSYLRRDGGKLKSKSIDRLKLKNIGMINLDIPGTKVYALKGAETMLKKQRPVVMVNLSGRDVVEMKAFMEPLSYDFVRLGAHSALFLPR